MNIGDLFFKLNLALQISNNLALSINFSLPAATVRIIGVLCGLILLEARQLFDGRIQLLLKGIWLSDVAGGVPELRPRVRDSVEGLAEITDTMIRKINAANDVFQHFMGKIDSREKFEAHRLELARNVWKRMKESDSRECRNCHDIQAMAPEMQGRTAQKQHLKARDGSKTCIDCHYGIAHHEPAGGEEPKDAVAMSK